MLSQLLQGLSFYTMTQRWNVTLCAASWFAKIQDSIQGKQRSLMWSVCHLDLKPS